MTPILGTPVVSATAAEMWATSRGATDTFVMLARWYWVLAPQRGGVRPEVAYAQAAKETAFGRFGGVIDSAYRNPCGMKIAFGGANSDPSAHQRFLDWSLGITAHVDHLALYAGAEGYSRLDTPDPRHFAAIRGTAVTVELLSGRWAPSPTYGQSIVRDFLQGMIG